MLEDSSPRLWSYSVVNIPLIGTGSHVAAIQGDGVLKGQGPVIVIESYCHISK